MGDLIGLDYSAVLDTLGLYVAESEIKEAFEFVLRAFNIEREFRK